MAASDPVTDWSALPAGVLQHIFSRASAWQIPGSCLASRVCSSWRAAAPGCRGIRLLYGYIAGIDYWRTQAFAAWLQGNAQQLQSLILGELDDQDVLGPLLAAATAAMAAGKPLPLHTLRVLRPSHDLHHIGALLANLPNLHTLQAGLDNSAHMDLTKGLKVEEQMAPLRQATQLQELYWSVSDVLDAFSEALAKLLPLSIRRLSWSSSIYLDAPDVSHLTQLTVLHLVGTFAGCDMHKLPPSCELLELVSDDVHPAVWAAQQRVLVRLGYAEPPVELQAPGTGKASFTCLSKLGTLAVIGYVLCNWHNDPVMTQLTALSALKVRPPVAGVGSPSSRWDVSALLSTPQFANGLRRLDLGDCISAVLPHLSLLTQLTWLRCAGEGVGLPPHAVATQQLCCSPRLKWLSVPGVLLNGGQDWLGSMQQLRVIVLTGKSYIGDSADEVGMEWPWLVVDAPLLLPPRLLVVGCLLAMHPYVQRRVAGSGCEVVDESDLHAACDPTQQLAGVAEALQQALA
jgi:hypothetical protein